MIKRTTATFKDGSIVTSGMVKPCATVVKPGGERAIAAEVISSGLTKEDWDEIVVMEKCMDVHDRTIRITRE